MSWPILKGLSCIGIAFFLLWYAYKNRLNPRKALIAILLTGLLLRLFTSLDPYLHEWDERFHALVAKNMTGNMLMPVLNSVDIFEYDYRDWTNNHVWLHKPPLSLWVISLSMQLFGTNEAALRLPSILLSVTSVFLTYKIAQRLYPRKNDIALLAAFFQAVNGFVIDMASGRIPTDHVDTMLLFWIELGIWYAICAVQDGISYKRMAILGIITGMGILCKWYVALLIPFVFFLYAVQHHRAYLQAALSTVFQLFIAFSISGVWSYYAWSQFPAAFIWEQQFNARHLFEAIEGHSGAWWYFLDKARINWSEGIYVVWLFFLFQLYTKHKKADFLLLAWVLLPYVLFSASATKMDGYVMIAAPAIFIMIAIFCMEILAFEKNKKSWSILAGLMIILALRYCIERVKPFDQDPAGVLQQAEISKFRTVLPDDASTLVLNNKWYIETMFYTNMVSRRNIPSENEWMKVKGNFKNVGVVQDGHLPAFMLQDSSVVKLH